jgi:hypothetical protein
VTRDEDLWAALAGLFFLDQEPGDEDFERVAKDLKRAGWSREKTEGVLVRGIAPHAGGSPLWPVIGEGTDLDLERLTARVRRSLALREGRPPWFFCLSDWWHRRTLRQLGLEKLLGRL